jgi:hypothetical protein
VTGTNEWSDLFSSLLLSTGSTFAQEYSVQQASWFKEAAMNDIQRLAALRIVLIAVGLITLFAIWPLMMLWPSGWTWPSGHSDYPLMIVGIYATLGVFLLMASRDPLKHLSLIWFTVWSSIVHGVIMTVQSFGVEMDGTRHVGHLAGDVPALFIIAAVLAFLTPRGDKVRDLARVTP